MKIDLIAGTRPNFVKIAAIIHAIETYGPHIKYRFIHTGQHYDKNLSGNFFKNMPLPLHFRRGYLAVTLWRLSFFPRTVFWVLF